MALTDSEIQRIRYELGYNVLSIGAEPYVTYHAIFDQVVKTYLNAGATTTSSTAVVAASTPTPVALTLASATGFAAMAAVVVDVDSRMERATIQSISGSVINVMLSLAHSGTYPVTVEGGETMVREALDKCRAVETLQRQAATHAGIKKVDEVEFFESRSGGSAVSRDLAREREMYRRELSDLLNVPYLREMKRGGGCSYEPY